MTGPKLAASEKIQSAKHRLRGESHRDSSNRQAAALKDNDEHYHSLREIYYNQRFANGGRVQVAIGTDLNTTAYNCYVSGTIADSFVDGDGNIADRVKEAIATMRMGGGIGYDFSTLRPRGSLIKKLGAQATGPVSIMEIPNAACLCIQSAGHRRGAQMGVLRIDHPDIEEFIHIKNNQNKLTGFNISIAVTNEFMDCLLQDRPFDLRFDGEVYKTVDPKALWELVMRSTWDWSEPGVLFIDNINRMNNLWYCETISATNPCGEQPLPPYGACLLGSFNLVKYVKPGLPLLPNEFYEFDWYQLQEDIPHVVRALDNVIDRTIYPLPQQEEEAKAKRRMGIGVMGLANAVEALGHPYGSKEFIQTTRSIMWFIANNAYRASIELAKEKGSFPLFDKEKYLQSEFIHTLEKDVQEGIAKHGIRNSHLTSIAPTGTIAFAADYVSSGVEPVFGFENSPGVYSYEGKRIVQSFDGEELMDVSDYGFREFGVEGKVSQNVTAKEHIDVLVAAQEFSDSAVSKTVIHGPDMPWEDFKNLYIDAWKRGAKGCTTFNTGGKRAGIFVADEDGESCQIDLETGRKNCE